MRHRLYWFPLIASLASTGAGCSKSAPTPEPAPATETPAPTRAVPSATETRTVTVRDPQLEREAARLRIQVLEKDAQIADLERQVQEAMTEVVRAMARMRTLASRAEAASAMAEAEVAVQQLTTRAGRDQPDELSRAEAHLKSAGGEFEKENYGGALYLANQAKRAATTARGRLAGSDGGAARQGETAFAVAIPLETNGTSNVRSGPGTSFGVVATLPAGSAFTALAYVQDWIKVSLPDGRTGWVSSGLVRAPK